MLTVQLDRDERPDWTTSQLDEAKAARRLAAARDALDRLRQRDPGGDITLCPRPE